MKKTRIAVVGSMNMDVVTRVEHHPLPGQTVHSMATSYSPGGKGANQAVAAARAGADVWMIAAVGTDAFARELVSALEKSEVHTEHVLNKATTSGMALITVDAVGENCIVLSSGANGMLSCEDMQAAETTFDQTDVVLLQNEVPWETTMFAIRLVRDQHPNTKIYVNPAPARQLKDEELQLIDVLILNETEASIITGQEVMDAASEEQAVGQLRERGAKEVVLTLGVKGCIYAGPGSDLVRVPAFPVQPADTTAAGDTFIGAFASVDGNNGMTLANRLRFASAAAALAVTREGAQASIPTYEEIQAFLDQAGSVEEGNSPTIEQST